MLLLFEINRSEITWIKYHVVLRNHGIHWPGLLQINVYPEEKRKKTKKEKEKRFL
jgi:hypothetical protein